MSRYERILEKRNGFNVKQQVIVFDFPEATPSNNKIMRMHYWKRKKENERVHWITRAIIGYRSAPPITRCKLIITRHGSRLLDDDNLAGGFKFLIDSLVNNKIIQDDKPSCIVAKEYLQLKTSRTMEKTTVEIYQLI